MLVALETPSNARTEATVAEKGHGYICPTCSEKVIFAKGLKYRWHFRHDKNSTCLSAGETWQHEEAKSSILLGARCRQLSAEPEVPVLSIEGDRRADVIIWAPQTDPPKPDDQRRLAFEVQYSAVDCDALISRTQAYMAAGVPVIWIPVVDESKFKSLESVVGPSIFRISGYSTPPWVETIHALHGHLWFYVPQTKAYWRGWLLDHMLYKSPTEGYDAQGEYHTSGGYWYSAKRERDLYLEGPYDFGALKIARVNKSDNALISADGQRRFLVELQPVADGSLKICPIAKRRKPHIVNGRDTGFYSYEDCLRLDDRLLPAAFKACAALPANLNPLPSPPA